MAESIVKQKSYDFALRIVRLCSHLKDQYNFEIARQLLKSGTSIGANIEEALAGQSKKDFFAKMCIASKEAREAHYWLRLINDSGIIENNKIKNLLEASEELVKILTSIVKTGYTEKTKNLELKTKD